MPSEKQIILAKKFLENMGNNNPKTKGELMLEVGYSETTSKNPYMIFNSKGFKKNTEGFLEDIGLDKSSRLCILSEIAHDRNESGQLKDKRAVIAALAEANKMMGDYTPTEISLSPKIQKSREKFFQ